MSRRRACWRDLGAHAIASVALGYNASSAAPVQSSIASMPGASSATPMLSVTGTPPTATREDTARRNRSATSSAASWPVPGSSTPNSSPP